MWVAIGAGDLEVFMEKSRSWRQNWFELQKPSGRLVYLLRSFACLSICLFASLSALRFSLDLASCLSQLELEQVLEEDQSGRCILCGF